MKLDRAKNAKNNIVFGLLNKIAAIFLPFIVRTVMTKTIGVDYLGLNSLFTSILTVLSLAEMGFSGAVVYNMYQPIAREDRETICALLNFYRKVYRWVGSVILVVGLCLMPALPHLISGSYPADINLYVIYAVYLLNTALSYFLFAYLSALISAYQRDDVISRNNMLFNFLLNILQIVVLLTLKDYYVYAILMPVCTILNNLRIAYVAKKMFPQYKCQGKLDHSIVQDIKVRVSGLLLFKVCGTSRNAFDSIFISSFLGLSITAIYNNYYYIIAAVTAFLGIISTAVAGGVGNSVVTESLEKNYADMSRMDFLYMTISGWCTVCLLCLMQPFMEIWMGKDLMFSMPVVMLLCLYFYVLKMGDIRTVYVQVNGLWWENRYRSIAEAIGNLILNFFLGKYFGIYGIIVATLVTLFLINFCYGSRILFQHYFVEQKISRYYLRHGIYFAVTAAIAAITYWVCSKVQMGSWGNLILRGMICCILPLALYVAVYFNYQLGRESTKWLKKILH